MNLNRNPQPVEAAGEGLENRARVNGRRGHFASADQQRKVDNKKVYVRSSRRDKKRPKKVHDEDDSMLEDEIVDITGSDESDSEPVTETMARGQGFGNLPGCASLEEPSPVPVYVVLYKELEVDKTAPYSDIDKARHLAAAEKAVQLRCGDFGAAGDIESSNIEGRAGMLRFFKQHYKTLEYRHGPCVQVPGNPETNWRPKASMEGADASFFRTDDKKKSFASGGKVSGSAGVRKKDAAEKSNIKAFRPSQLKPKTQTTQTPPEPSTAQIQAVVYPRSYPYPAEQCYYPNDILVEVHRAEDPAGREFVVQDVLDHRGEGSARQYMVKFLGYELDAEAWIGGTLVERNDHVLKYEAMLRRAMLLR